MEQQRNQVARELKAREQPQQKRTIRAWTLSWGSLWSAGEKEAQSVARRNSPGWRASWGWRCLSPEKAFPRRLRETGILEVL